MSRYGRVNYVLARRIELLEEVKRLQKSLGVPGDASYTCETAGYFFLYQVRDFRVFKSYGLQLDTEMGS